MSATIPSSFFWSPSRQRWFQQCQRAYFYRYYAAPAGRLAEAPPRRRETYALCGLLRRPEWIRVHTHRAFRAFVVPDPAEPAPSVEASVLKFMEVVRTDFRASRQGGNRLLPKTTNGLFEHEYEIPVSDAAWKELVERAAEDLRRMLQTGYAGEAQKRPAERRMFGEGPARFEWDGLPIDLRVDLGEREDGGIRLHRWLFTAEDPAGRMLARAALVAMAMKKAAVPLEQISLTEVSLFSGEEQRVKLSAEEMEDSRERVHDMADEMRFPLADPERDLAREEDFEGTDDEAACHGCPFLKVCSKWNPS